MVYKNQSEQFVHPLFEIIKKEYGWINVFFIFFSMFFMGSFITLIYLHSNKETLKIMLITAFVFSFLFFILGISPFVIKTFEILNSVSWPSFAKILIKIIQVFCFTFFLIAIVCSFNFFIKDKINPFRSHIKKTVKEKNELIEDLKKQLLDLN